MNITINVAELYDLVSAMKSDGMDLVEISIVEADTDEPKFIAFECCKRSTPWEGVDYESIDGVE